MPGFVEQAVAQAPTNDHAHNAEEQQIFHITARPCRITVQAIKRRLLKAACSQPQKQAKRGQISQAIPVNGNWPQLQGDGINLWVHQHPSIVPQASASAITAAPHIGANRE